MTNEKNTTILAIRSDHGIEFKNSQFDKFYCNHGISHNFSTPKIPQQNGIAEKKNKTLVEMARTMLCESQLLKYFWVEAVNIVCYILNRALIRPILRNPPYELWNNQKLEEIEPIDPSLPRD